MTRQPWGYMAVVGAIAAYFAALLVWPAATDVLVRAGLAALVLVLYALPLWVARRRQHPNATAITALTIFGGWTVIGWVVAVVWAYTEPRR